PTTAATQQGARQCPHRNRPNRNRPRQSPRVANRGRRRHPLKWSWNKPTSSKLRSPKWKKRSKPSGGSFKSSKKPKNCLKGCSAMPLLPGDLRSRLPPFFSQEDADPVVYARFHLPGTNRAWYVIEGQLEG